MQNRYCENLNNNLKISLNSERKYRARICKRFRSSEIDSRKIDSANLCSLAGRYSNLI